MWRNKYTNQSLPCVHLFNCLTQISNQPITSQQLIAFQLGDMVKTTC